MGSNSQNIVRLLAAGAPTAVSCLGAAAMMTEHEAAAELRLSVKTLRNWRVAGKGPQFCVYETRAVRYRRSDLEAYIVSARRRSTSDKGQGGV